MEKLETWIIPAILAALVLLGAAAAFGVSGPDLSIQSPYDRAMQSAVQVVDPEGGQGSGVVVTDQGVLLTNAHVCRDKREFIIVRPDTEQVRAEVLWTSPFKSDLCLLMVYPSDLAWVPIEMRSEPLALGEEVFAIGSPFGLDFTLTTGTVARTTFAYDNQEKGDRVQIDVVTGPGSSGGPLLDMDGRLVGLVNSGLAATIGYSNRIPLGYNFAIPTSVIERLLAR